MVQCLENMISNKYGLHGFLNRVYVAQLELFAGISFPVFFLLAPRDNCMICGRQKWSSSDSALNTDARPGAEADDTHLYQSASSPCWCGGSIWTHSSSSFHQVSPSVLLNPESGSKVLVSFASCPHHQGGRCWETGVNSNLFSWIPVCPHSTQFYIHFPPNYWFYESVASLSSHQTHRQFP